MAVDRPPQAGLSVQILTVEELFAGSYTFDLPWFQRAYAWTEDLARRFLSDINRAYARSAQRYVIGRILLARTGGETRYVLVDGQQRAVTLMILFALFRHKLADTPWVQRIVPLLEADNKPDGIEYRLEPQPALAAFFHEHVQSPDAVSNRADEFGASEVERNILSNRSCLNELLEELETEGCDLAGLAEYLLTRCLLTLTVVEDEEDDEAWKMLQTEENTGLAFHDAARTKITLIEAMKPPERDEAGRLWDKCQAKLGDDGMEHLVTHVRNLSGRQRSSQPVEKDIVTRFKLNARGLGFMHETLVPSAGRFSALRRHNVAAGAARAEIGRYLRHMEWAEHDYWCPAAMRWLEIKGEGHPQIVDFFRLLSRKVWLLRIGGADSVEHERRFISLSNQIADGGTIVNMSELDVPDRWINKTRDNLLSRTFFDKRYSRPVLRYLSDLMGSDPGPIDGDVVTIEHVLPRNPRRRSTWAKMFGSPNEISNHAHRIGNLALLSFKDNQKVGNSEYAEKRNILRNSGFVLSADAAAADEWTGDHVLARSERLVRVLLDHWQLKP